MRLLSSPFAAILLFILLIPFCSLLHAQSLWGTTQGRFPSFGAVYKTDLNGENLELKRSFKVEFEGRLPKGRVIEGNGKLYGITAVGGVDDAGLVFEYDPATGIYLKKFDFPDHLVDKIWGDPVFVDGKLFGLLAPHVTPYGSLFKIDLTTGVFTVLQDFNFDIGRCSGSLVHDGNGKLYGIVSEGESSSMGGIFEYDISLDAFEVKHRFDYTYVETWSSMVMVNGVIYGVTTAMGNESKGTIFTYDPQTNTSSIVHHFASSVGSHPNTGLVQSANGKLYGVAAGGNHGKGVLYEFDPANNSYSAKHHFTRVPPVRDGLVADADNNIYGVTQSFLDDFGYLFRLDPSTAQFDVVHNFPEFHVPSGGLRKTTAGKMVYMTVAEHAPAPVERLIEFKPATSERIEMFMFNSHRDGLTPNAHLTRTFDGKIYGTTRIGGANGGGTLFEVDPATGDHKRLYDFKANEDGFPVDVIVAPDNKIYGIGNTSSNAGILFHFDPATSIFKSIPLDAAEAFTVVERLIHVDGQLYGVSKGGGQQYVGAIFKYDMSSEAVVKVHDFDNANGSEPMAGLTIGANGKLYGVTYRSGGTSDGSGVLFEYDIAKKSYTKKIQFANATHGSHPSSPLVLANNGKLYGISYRGSESFGTGQWILFEYDPTNNSFVKKLEKDIHFNTELPYSNMTLLPDGKLVGAISHGGVNKSGFLFEYDPETNSYSENHQFEGGVQHRPMALLYHSGKEGQSIAFDPIVAHDVNDGTFELVAVASSTLPVTFKSSDPSIASVNGNVVTLHKHGHVTVTASQAGNASFDPADVFVRVLPINNLPPQLVGTIEDRSVLEGIPFSFSFDEDIFEDEDHDELSYSARLASGSVLPGWLTLNGATRTFSGTPPLGSAGDITVRLAAHDDESAYTSIDFVIHVNVVTAIEHLSFGNCTISPNPTAGIVILELEKPLNGSSVNLEVINTLGGKIPASAEKISDRAFEIDLQKLPPQIYLIRMRVGNSSRIFKVIKL